MRALGERDDWEELRVAGALLAVGTNLFSHPGVHYLSGFFGPIERMLREAGANISFAAADFRRLAPLLRGRQAERDGYGRRAARRRRLLQPLAARRRDDRGVHARGRRSGPDPRRRGLGSLPAHVRRRAAASAPPARRRDRPARPRRGRAARAARRHPRAGPHRDRLARAPLHPERRDAPDRDRRDPVGDRRAARRGRRRRVRRALGDVHRRPDGPARGRQGHEHGQGDLRRRQRRDVRDGFRGASTSGSTRTTKSPSCPSTSSTIRTTSPRTSAWSR